MTLHGFLTRLIWLCVLPLIFLSIYLVVDNIQDQESRRDQEATDLVHNVGNAIDRVLEAKIAGLELLAASPLVEDPARHGEFYREASAFQRNFGSHVLLADLDGQMRLNTRAPFGTPLPKIPHVNGRAAFPAALESGKPAVGDQFVGPVARELLVAVAVPVLRDDRPVYVLLSVIESRQFQRRLDELALPADWSMTLADSNGAVIAHRGPVGQGGSGGERRRFSLKSALSPWEVSIEAPTGLADKVTRTTTLTLALMAAGAVLAGIFGGMVAARRLTRTLGSLVGPQAGTEGHSAIVEVETIRHRLDVEAEARKAAYDELDAYKQNLEGMIAARTRELEATLVELTRSNRDLEQFAYVASHDLRHPLRMVSSYLTLIEKALGAELSMENREYFRFAVQGALRMDAMISGLLEYARIGRGGERFEAIGLNSVVEESLINLQAARGEAQIIVAAGLPSLWGDHGELVRLFQNLVGNALKYKAPDRPVRVEIGWADGRDEWDVWVRDNGIGIAPEFREQVFAIFQRLVSKEEYEGTGIGLAVCRRIVEHHGGRIWIESPDDHGCAFHMAFPKLRAAAE
jgi:signal transduction histidine kinase